MQWMMDREEGVEEGHTRSHLLHPLWKEFSDSSGKYSTLYCNPHTGRYTYLPEQFVLGKYMNIELYKYTITLVVANTHTLRYTSYM